MLAAATQDASANIGRCPAESALAEALLQEVAAVARRVALERAEHGAAELLVEAARLEAVGVEPDIAAAARDRLRLGAPQEIAAEPGAAQRLGQPQQID